MLTSPFDILKIRLHRWLHDYHHRAQAKEKQIKRWRKFKARLAEELEKEGIYELRGVYLPFVWRKPERFTETMIRVCEAINKIDPNYTMFGSVFAYNETYVRALFSRMIDVRVSGPGGSVIFGRKTKWGKERK